MDRTEANEAMKLSLDVEEVKSELAVPEAKQIGTGSDTDSELDKQASGYVAQLLAVSMDDETARQEASGAVESMGADAQRRAAEGSKMLQQPIRDLAAKGEDGGEVAGALVQLKNQVEGLDPGKFDFEAGWMSRLAGRIPGIGTPMKRYFTKFESAQTMIDAIDRSLIEGQRQLKRDNITLIEDQKQMRESAKVLERQIALGNLLDGKLEGAAEGESDKGRQEFIETELLFPLRQRVTDLHQQLAVSQQGVVAIEIIRRNNVELIRGVDRARNVTMNALKVAVTVALGVQNQKIVLDKIGALNETTSSLIASTAQAIRTRGTEIHRQASSATLDLEALRGAFRDINTAMEEIASYRREALPKLRTTIDELETITDAGEEAIVRMEQGRRNNAAGLLSDDTA